MPVFTHLTLPTRADVRVFFLLAACQFSVYFLFSVNARALAQGRVAWTFCTDILFAIVNYSIIKGIAENKNPWGRAGYVLGGACGTVPAIYLTKMLFGQ